MNQLVALAPTQMAALAPNWATMRSAIAKCERLDEIRSLSDKALALRAYYSQSQDVDNEVAAMRIRLRAERRLGELIQQEQEAGRLAKKENGRPSEVSSITTLSSIGIPRDRSARAQKLANVPEDQFEAALQAPKPSATSIAALSTQERPKANQIPIDVEPVLKTWGMLRDFAACVSDGSLLEPESWSDHPGIQQFQIAEILAAIPIVISYLTNLERTKNG